MRCLILLSLLLLQSECEPPATERARGYYVRICSQDDISDLIAFNNQWLANTDVRFVQSSDSCDVSVRFGEMPKKGAAKGAAAVSYTITGRVVLSRRSATDLMHEILHVAGVPHEDDPDSIMWTHTGGASNLHSHHVEALRRLAGITPLGRVGAQIGVMR